MRLILFFVAAILFTQVTFSDNSPQKKVYPFNYSEIKDSVFYNPYFGMAFPIPGGWTVQNRTQIEMVTEAAKKIATTEDERLNQVIEETDLNSMTLLMLSKYEYGSPVPFNPNIVLIAEDISLFPGVKTGSDYLFHAKRLLTATNMGYEVTDHPGEEKKIGGYDFNFMETAVSTLGTPVLQLYISTIIKRYAFSIIISYSTEAEKEELLAILENIEFEK